MVTNGYDYIWLNNRWFGLVCFLFVIWCVYLLVLFSIVIVRSIVIVGSYFIRLYVATVFHFLQIINILSTFAQQSIGSNTRVCMILSKIVDVMSKIRYHKWSVYIVIPCIKIYLIDQPFTGTEIFGEKKTKFELKHNILLDG